MPDLEHRLEGIDRRIRGTRQASRSLELLHLSPVDIERRLKNQSIAVEDVFLMTLDDCGNTFLQKKEGRA